VTQTASANDTSLTVTVNGAMLQGTELGQIVDVSVEQDVHLPEAFAIRLRDTRDLGAQSAEGYFGLLNDDRFALGAAIEIRMGRDGNSQSIMIGEVTAVEMDARPSGDAILTVRGYDQSHRLHRQRKTRTFVQVMDSDLVRVIAREYGLIADVSVDGPLHEHLYQDNQTDLELLRARASDLGCEVYVRDKRLVLRRPAPTEEPPSHALFGTLQRVHMRQTAPSQVSEVVVRGWDADRKEAIVGIARTPSDYIIPEIGDSRSGALLASNAFGEGRYAVSAHNVSTQDEAQRLAQAIYDEIAGEFVQLDGTCAGDPSVRAGQQINLTNMGTRFSGTYYVTSVIHRTTPDDGYLTTFTVSGRQPVTLSAVLAGGGASANGFAHRGFQGVNGNTGRHAGVVVGVVTNNKPAGNDAAKYVGRVKVKFPWLSDEQDSRWARIATPMAGAGRGFQFLPEVNDEVLVAFEHGDINRPYVVGSLWNGKDRPPRDNDSLVAADGKVRQRIIRSRTGHTIILDDSDETPGITIVDKTEKNLIALNSRTNTLTISADGDLEINAKGAVRVTGRSLAFEATSDDATMRGRNATIEAKSGLVTAKGITASVEASAGRARVRGAGGTDVEAVGGLLTIKGPQVHIN
jgi:phage protein D